MNLIIKSILVVFCIGLLPLIINAQGTGTDQQSQSVGSSKGGTTLNFDGDVIEGERKRPDMFLELKSDELNIEASVYSRPDFNDFFENEKELTPKYNK